MATPSRTSSRIKPRSVSICKKCAKTRNQNHRVYVYATVRQFSTSTQLVSLITNIFQLKINLYHESTKNSQLHVTPETKQPNRGALQGAATGRSRQMITVIHDPKGIIEHTQNPNGGRRSDTYGTGTQNRLNKPLFLAASPRPVAFSLRHYTLLVPL